MESFTNRRAKMTAQRIAETIREAEAKIEKANKEIKELEKGKFKGVEIKRMVAYYK